MLILDGLRCDLRVPSQLHSIVELSAVKKKKERKREGRRGDKKEIGRVMDWIQR